MQAVAGTGDFSNLEQPESYVEALKRSADPAAPARLAFGPRSIGYTLFPNLSANGWGEPDARGQAVRELNRNLDFRKAVTMAIDRQRLGESLVKGPFTAIYPGGILYVTGFYDKDSTVYYPYDLDARQGRAREGRAEGHRRRRLRQLPGRTAGGKTSRSRCWSTATTPPTRASREGVVAMMEPLGIRVIPNILSGNDRDAAQQSGKFDWMVLPQRPGAGHRWCRTPTQLAPVGPQTALQPPRQRQTASST